MAKNDPSADRRRSAAAVGRDREAEVEALRVRYSAQAGYLVSDRELAARWQAEQRGEVYTPRARSSAAKSAIREQRAAFVVAGIAWVIAWAATNAQLGTVGGFLVGGLVALFTFAKVAN